MGATRLRIYEPGQGSRWMQAAAFTDDDLCPVRHSFSRPLTFRSFEF